MPLMLILRPIIKQILIMVAAGAIFSGGMSVLQHHSDLLTPTPTAPQPVTLQTDPQSAPFDGLDMEPKPEPASASPGATDPSTPTVEKGATPAPAVAVAVPHTQTLEELVTAFLRNYEALKDANQRQDKFHKDDYLKERGRLAEQVFELVPVESQAPEAAPSRESEYLNARAQESPEAIEDLRVCLKVLLEKKAGK